MSAFYTGLFCNPSPPGLSPPPLSHHGCLPVVGQIGGIFQPRLECSSQVGAVSFHQQAGRTFQSVARCSRCHRFPRPSKLRTVATGDGSGYGLPPKLVDQFVGGPTLLRTALIVGSRSVFSLSIFLPSFSENRVLCGFYFDPT